METERFDEHALARDLLAAGMTAATVGSAGMAGPATVSVEQRMGRTKKTVDDGP